MMIFFENDRCLKCDHPLGFVPETLELIALEQAKDNQWRALGSAVSGQTYRRCANHQPHNVCNWLVPAGDPAPFCQACRLNELVPNLSEPKNVARWFKLELAKRRCLYTFLKLGLPLSAGPAQGLPSLCFRFLQEMENAPVKTGHLNGVITVNIAEADDDERERRRIKLHEPYRTLVGHLRHESGHFYWTWLIDNSPNLPRFRELFGNETTDYDAALQTYYKQGPPTDWAARAVTPYGCSHPWEDWAETWAHYLHIVDTLESAAAFGLGVLDNASEQARQLNIKHSKSMDFPAMLAQWTPLVCALNAINRGMGLADLYPFVISTPVVEKLRFIHQVVTDFRLPPNRAPKEPASAKNQPDARAVGSTAVG
jgi:hypothetical protein